MPKTKIQWTQHVWNPIVGCTIATPGCTNCYAMKIASRLGTMPNMPQYHDLTKKVNGNAVWTGKMNLVESVLTNPLKRNKPTMYFVNSMGDLFHESVPDEWIDRVFAVMALCPQHTFQVLTKRADRMREYMRRHSFDRIVMEMMQLRESGGWPTINEQCRRHGIPHSKPTSRDDWWPLPNVWLGVSVEDQTRADERIPLLLDTPAAVRFVSAEPLLGAVDLSAWIHNPVCRAFDPTQCTCDPDDIYPELDWVIVGGESGSKARPMHPDWARSLRAQCLNDEVPFFFKQWGAWAPLIDRDNDDPDWRQNYGRAGRYPKRFTILNLEGGTGFHGERVHLMGRTTKATGNLLDGKEWQQMPEVAQ